MYSHCSKKPELSTKNLYFFYSQQLILATIFRWSIVLAIFGSCLWDADQQNVMKIRSDTFTYIFFPSHLVRPAPAPFPGSRQPGWRFWEKGISNGKKPYQGERSNYPDENGCQLSDPYWDQRPYDTITEKLELQTNSHSILKTVWLRPLVSLWH